MERPNEKLIAAKKNIARSGDNFQRTERSTDRLPPGQRLAKGWPVLDLGIQPEISRDNWKLEIKGAAESRVFDWTEFSTLPQETVTTDFHCVTTWSIFDAKVTGVRWPVFLDVLNVSPDTTHAMFHGYDGYSTNLPLAELEKPDCMIIHSFDSEPLGREHGGPVRTWVPHIYAWKSIKWIKAIEFMTDDRKGYWENRGYHNEADPWLEQRFG
ncbi:MAG: molybdopterin-dependent oxidoreductase [Planctomycetota bacterium]|jgi:DMSO/TMAO reductase YedYZ molybdopterin-dependent catalytic subunit